MPNIDVCGLVTREVKYGENSRILTVLAKDIRQGFGSCQHVREPTVQVC